MKVDFNWRDYDYYKKWFQDVLTTLYEENNDLREEKVKLLRENQQLKKQKDDVVECLKELSDNTDDTTCYEIDRNSRNDLLRMLGEIE